MSYHVLDLEGNDITARSRLQCASMPTLRDALESHGLPVSGTKAQCAQRLVDIGMTAERLEADHGWRARDAKLSKGGVLVSEVSDTDREGMRAEFDAFRDGAGHWEKLSPFEIAWAFWNGGAQAVRMQGPVTDIDPLARIRGLLATPTDEREITWDEWIDGGLGGDFHEKLHAILEDPARAVPVEHTERNST